MRKSHLLLVIALVQSLLQRTPDGSLKRVDPAGLRTLLQDKASTLWLDVQDPTPADLEMLSSEFDFHELALEDVDHPAQRPKLEEYGSFYFLVFYSLLLSEDGKLLARELDLFIGENYLVTVHNGQIRELEEAIRRWQLGYGRLDHGVGSLLYSLLDSVVDGYFQVADATAEKVSQLEERSMEAHDQRLVRSVFGLKKELLNARRILGPERDVLNALMRQETPLLDPRTSIYLRDVYDHLSRIMDTHDLHNDVLTGILDMYLSAVSNRLNQIMKTLTSVTIILMTMALISGIYGMNFVNMPELKWQYGYYWALGLMAGSAVLLYLYLRWKDWL